MPVVTYQELADALGITLESARRTARKKRWAKTIGNDKLSRIDVPEEVFANRPQERPKMSPEDRPEDTPQDTSQAPGLERIRALEAEIAALRELVAAERGRADAERARADAEASRMEEIHLRLADLAVDRDRWHALASRPWWRRLAG